MANSVQPPPMTNRYQLTRLMPRKGQVLGPDHQRQAEVAQHRRHHRHQEEEHHDDAVQREQPVVGVGRDQPALGRHQVQADDGDGHAADEEHHRDRDQVQEWRCACGPWSAARTATPWPTLRYVLPRLLRAAAAAAAAVPGWRCSSVCLLPGVDGRRASAGGGNSSTRRGVSPRCKRLDEGDQLDDLLLAHLALERRHDVLVSRPRSSPRGRGSTRADSPRRR